MIFPALFCYAILLATLSKQMEGVALIYAITLSVLYPNETYVIYPTVFTWIAILPVLFKRG
jgi:hypothetical protein